LSIFQEACRVGAGTLKTENDMLRA
jgi:hypothetical protein